MAFFRASVGFGLKTCRLKISQMGGCVYIARSAPFCQPDGASLNAVSVGIRVFTIFMAPPQQGHLITGLFARAIRAFMGFNLSSSCSSANSFLLLECRNPKLRVRRKPLGNTCCKTSHKNWRRAVSGSASAWFCRLDSGT